MGSNFCMNELCRATTSSEWKKGWGLKSGGYATLCSNCGSAYEHLAFCEMYHMNESGWRECRVCGKRIHCGCIASIFLYDHMDYGGISCMNCARCLGGQIMRTIQMPSTSSNHLMPNGALPVLKIRDTQMEGLKADNFEKGKLLHLTKTKAEPTVKEVTCLPNLNQKSLETTIFGKPEVTFPVKDTYQSLNQTPMSFSLTTPIATSTSPLQFLEQNKGSPSKPQQVIIPKAIKVAGSESKKGTQAPNRIARPPPGEGRCGRNQLLPRYWPRITDQELQKLSGDLKSNIVPLFEKVLSASDAGRIGRLVLPKACAEAYFPAINNSEGIAIRVQDINGQEWSFQFRFWPNNNSRMYVLEGVTPCIQSMQLQAGDTVTFSRIDPGGKLVMGFRKATNNNSDTQVKLLGTPTAGSSAEIQVSGATDNDMNESRAIDEPMQKNASIPEKKKTRNIGPKNKRLLMQAKDALKLKITWEEAQDLLRPPPSGRPTIVVVDEYEFEEYEEPPVLGKKTVFTSRSSGEQEQWAQCDSCSKWRRLPADALLPPKWTCSDNIWDPSRCSCSAPDEINPKEPDTFLRDGKDSKRRRVTENSHDCEPSGLDALATVAVLGDNIGGLGEPSSAGVGPTTKHPRHRPGCSCIVCIQPPSGKGKHLPTCKCNVCLTVKRRFKTLMLRKKKKQSEREAELIITDGGGEGLAHKDESETDGVSGLGLLMMNINHSENDSNPNGDDNNDDPAEDGGTSKGQLDLNCDPDREDDMLVETGANDIQAEGRPRQNGLETLGECFLVHSGHMKLTSTDTIIKAD